MNPRHIIKRDNLVFHCTFGQGTGTTLVDRTGTCAFTTWGGAGQTIEWAANKYGNGLKFQTDKDYVYFSDVNLPHTTDSCSMQVLVKFNALPSSHVMSL